MDYLNLLEKRTIRGAGKKQEGTAPQTAEKTDGPAPVQRTGLSAAEVEQLRKRYGLNKLEGKKKKSAAVLFLSQFKDVLVLILIVSAVLSMMMGEMTEAVTILIIIGVNAVIGAVQEFRTEKTVCCGTGSMLPSPASSWCPATLCCWRRATVCLRTARCWRKTGFLSMSRC